MLEPHIAEGFENSLIIKYNEDAVNGIGNERIRLDATNNKIFLF